MFFNKRLRNKSSYKFVMMLGVVIVAIGLNATAVLAAWDFTLNHQVTGHYKTSYSIEGADYGADYGQDTYGRGVYMLNSNLHWNQAAVSWM